MSVYDELINRLKTRAEIRQQIRSEKDRIAADLLEAAEAIQFLQDRYDELRYDMEELL